MIGVLFLVSAVAGVLALILLFPDIRDAVVDRLRWATMLREVIHTDSRMLTDAIRLSMAHFQALNELRKLGGGR